VSSATCTDFDFSYLLNFVVDFGPDPEAMMMDEYNYDVADVVNALLDKNRMRRGIIDECCKRACYKSELIRYCPVRQLG